VYLVLLGVFGRGFALEGAVFVVILSIGVAAAIRVATAVQHRPRQVENQSLRGSRRIALALPHNVSGRPEGVQP